MKRQNKNRWKVILRLKVVGRWKDKGIKKVGESSIINDVDTDMAKREHSNIKRYASVFSNI